MRRSDALYLLMAACAFAVVIGITVPAFPDQLYCWKPTDNGTKNPPTCALSYEACQKLVSRNGGQCRSM